MRKNIFIAGVLLVLLFGSQCFAAKPAVIGGIRGGVALGIMLESEFVDSAKLRMGFEANTSNSPGLVFIGGKWFLTDVGRRVPMYLGGGVVGYFGNNSAVGPYISLIFERFLDITPMFLEFGIDVVNSGRLQLQAGYYF